MQILFSPAKKMRRDADTLPPAGLPRYLEQADRLRAYLKELPYEELKRLLACNDAIAQLNYRRYQTMDLRRDLTPAILAYDGIAVVVSPENPVSDLTLAQIADIYTGKITNWSEVGGNDAEIVLIGREAGSGTRDGFESITGTEEECQYRQELTSTGDVIATVSQNPNAIGYASLSAVKDTVKALSVGGVAPSEDTVKDGSYVIQRPFVLVTKDGVTLSPAAQAFLDYALSADAAPIIAQAGAVAANG